MFKQCGRRRTPEASEHGYTTNTPSEPDGPGELLNGIHMI